MPEHQRGPSTRSVHAGLPPAQQGEPFLPGPVLASAYHLSGDDVHSQPGYLREGNPTFVLERGEATHLPPALVIQGTTDDNVPNAIAERFAAAYRAAGGEAQLEWFPSMPHGFANRPGPESSRAHELIKAFIARQLATGRG